MALSNRAVEAHSGWSTDESTVLVPSWSLERARWLGCVTRWQVFGASSCGVAFGTAEVALETLHLHRLLIGLATCLGVTIVRWICAFTEYRLCGSESLESNK